MISKDNVKDFHDDLNAVLGVLSAKYGINLETGGITYGETGISLKITGKNRETSFGISGAELEYREYSQKFNYDPDSFGNIYTTNKGERYRIIGVRKTARKYCILCKNVETGDKTAFMPEITYLAEREDD